MEMDPAVADAPLKVASSKIRFIGCREELLLASSAVATALLTLYLFIIKYGLFSKLESDCNLRLLNSSLAWIDHGYWKLGGFLYFQEEYDGTLPLNLYKSHSPYYVLPHFWATSHAGKDAFWVVTGLIPVLVAFVLSLALAVIAWGSIKALSTNHSWAKLRGAPFVGATAAFSITFTSEPIWSLAWNSFDGSYSIVFLTVAIALTCLFNGRLIRWLSMLFVLLASLACARFGLVMLTSLLIIRFIALARRTSGARFAGSAFFSWPVIGLVFLLSMSHFVRVALAARLLGLQFRGSDLLPRMGLSSWWERAGQGPLNYLTPLDAFTFLWRQSGNVINNLPIWISIHHLMIWTLAIVSMAMVMGARNFFPTRPCLELLLFLPLTWTILLNQSAAEHPDLVAILWVPSYVLGLAFLATQLFAFLRRHLRKTHCYLYMSGLLWLFFLWQNQYIMRAYPQLL
ncbi:hypothetical protein [Cyanobium sp. ATX 6F1]|uniref:hypothetical protein n=2 Tax=unclassified Cyanobium TaxID=2627006 RepID=UPI0020CECF8C|nr:hypothetical protein [Cyanobium sp. ATX 6F1]MCP9916694.1 hypothetical protein [Cyanobium sp. ATX 6F1]